MTFAEKVIAFNRSLNYDGALPEDVKILNPFAESTEALNISSAFYRKFYSDKNQRTLILGINPGRHGAGITGIPFTDTKRLESHCDLHITGFNSHELSSVFIYNMIDAFGGVNKFYNRYYINSVCPLGFVKINNRGKEVNYNYYDNSQLFEMVKPFILESIVAQINLGVRTDIAYCLGRGKNFKYLSMINQEQKLFDRIVPLEHPRYIMQYKLKDKNIYISKFCNALDY